MKAIEANAAWWKRLAMAVLIGAYFIVVTRDGLTAGFAPDDMLAFHIYWHPRPLRLLTSQFMLWKGYFRPMGGFFYLPLFARYGLNPYPYHVALVVLLALGAWMVYRLARALGAGEFAAAFAAMMVCYRGGLANLYYNTVYVCDVLCGIFYWGALAYYARIRSSGKMLSGRQTLAFLGLYLCALNSKEMAITLPVLLLVYEWLYHGLPLSGVKALAGWLRGPGRVVFWAGLLDAFCLAGKAWGPEGLMKNPGYQRVYTWPQIVQFQSRYLADVFDQLEWLSGFAVCAVWVVVTYFAWRRDRPLLRFCWFYVLIAPIPVEFIIGRGEANLYVTMAGWAILAATLFAGLLPGAARVLGEEPLFRRLAPGVRYGLVAAVGMLLLAWESWSYKEAWIVSAIPKLAPLTAQVLEQFRVVNPKVPPGATVVFLEDPWPNGWDMSFIGELWFRDRKARILLNEKTPLSREEIAKADAVFTWRAGALLRLK